MMTRRGLLGMLGEAAGGALLLSRVGEAVGATDGARPQSMNPGVLVWDNHSGFDPRPDYDLNHLDEWRRAGVDYLSIDVGYDVIDWTLAVKNLASYIAWFEQRPDQFVLIRRVEDVLRAKRAGKMAISFDLEGMSALDDQASMVSLYYRLGVRQMLIAYNRNNAAGGGCHDEDHGLTEFGRTVIAEMNRVGMVLDCSHSGHRSTMEAMQMATQPVIFSHSNPKALRQHGRNITDDQIQACARTGGVIAINGIGLFLPIRESTALAMIDCITYVRDLVGVDHVGLGLDYAPKTGEDPLSAHPEFWPPAEYPSDYPMKDAGPDVVPALITGLRERHWSQGDLNKLLSGNFIRVARQVWK